MLSLFIGALLAPALAQPPPLVLAHESFTLDNGLRVILHPDRRSPLFSLEVRYTIGAGDEPISGIAHLFEHLMFEGSKNAPEAAYDRWLGAAGAVTNAWTDHDAMAFTVVGPAPALDLALYLEADRMADVAAGLDEDALSNQLAIVFSERDLNDSAPGGRDAVALARQLYPDGHPYRRRVLGEPERLQDITLDQIDAFAQAWLQPANATLTLGGDFDPDVARGLIAARFGGVESHPLPARRDAPEVVLEGEVRSVHYDEVTPTLYLTWPTVPAGHPDEAALDMLADLLSSGESSVLGAAVQTGRIAEARAWTDNRRRDGRLIVQVQHPRRSMAQLLREVDHRLARFLDEGPDPTALARHQRRWRSWAVRLAEGLE
ncbi:MAG: pitrilysin family protein, partial [Myxococcota bacterium]